MVLKPDHWTEFSIKGVIANEPLFFANGVEIHRADIIQPLAGIRLVILAQHLVAATDRQHHGAVCHCTADLLVLAPVQILQQYLLLKVLAAADKQQVVLGMVKGVAYGDLVYRHLDSPLPTAILQAHNIASIAVQIQQIRVQMRNSHFQNASLPKCSANLGRIAIIAV